MANQTLKTRINLKIDTLTNWNNSKLVLGKGEVAIATASSSAGTGLTEPVCMIKIGDGDHTFSGLDWNFHAKAADVLTACKTKDGLTAFINEVIANAGIASDDAMEALANRVTATETGITTLNGTVETEGSIAHSIKTAIDSLNLGGTYATKTEVATAEANAKSYADEKAGAAETAAKTAASEALATARTAISAEIDADVATLETALDARLDVLEAIQHETFATKAEMEAETAVRVAAEAKVLSDAQAYADGIKSDLLGESETLEGTYDTLKEIAGWINTHEGETVVELTTAIADEATTRENADNALSDRIKAYEDVKDTYATKTEVATAENAAKAHAETKASEAETNAKAHAETKASEAEAAAKSYADTKAGTAETNAKAHAETKASEAEAAAKSYADGLADNYATKAQGDKADTALQSITAGNGLKVSEKGTGVSQTISFDEECVFIFNCGNAEN